LYCPFGILRGRGNVFRSDHELSISGFPRSGNTFALKAFLLANPGVTVRSHRHNPTFTIQDVKQNKPEMMLIRNPVDAAISWAIYTKEPLVNTLAYYSDFHSVLRQYRDDLFLVSFDEVIEDFGKVTAAFNARWGSDYALFEHSAGNVARCMAEIEAEYLDKNGKVIESKVPRPSTERRSQKEVLLRQLNRSSVAQKELQRANELYYLLAPKKFSSRKPLLNTNTTQSIRLRPAT
jgi:hypothetical protein